MLKIAIQDLTNPFYNDIIGRGWTDRGYRDMFSTFAEEVLNKLNPLMVINDD